MAERENMLKKISEISFTVNDLTLFLDTHPLDENALGSFDEAMAQRKQLMKSYAENYEPLSVDCVCTYTNNKSETHTKYAGTKHFTWSDGPLPWEGGTL